ncbi:MAG: type III-A CRISPR-associated RAMP protein Csm4 [Aquificota bacterium]|nr:MAG: type III-A CRISPR-associated RAMP protein Csm4 [Aquificota bacterium]
MLLEFVFRPRGFVGRPVRSFTLFGAICWGVKYLYSEERLKDMLNMFKEKPPFVISSPIYEIKGELYFPKPQMPTEGIDYCKEGVKIYSELKKIKKRAWVKESVFKGFLDGKIRSINELVNVIEEENKVDVKKVLLPHAQINRLTSTTVGGEYYVEEAYSVPAFRVFVRFFDESYRDMVISALRFVPLGKNKSTGFGCFDVQVEEKDHWILEYLEPRSEKMVLLSESLYDSSYELEESMYDVFVYRGAVENYYEKPSANIWKKRLLYLEPGSVIKVKEKKQVYGSIRRVQLDEGFSVYQYGYAFGLFVRESHGGA